jgi:hypothetical protein
MIGFTLRESIPVCPSLGTWKAHFNPEHMWLARFCDDLELLRNRFHLAPLGRVAANQVQHAGQLRRTRFPRL